MPHLRLMLIAGIVGMLLAAAKPPFGSEPQGRRQAEKTPNDLVVEAARSYPDGGGYNWTGNATGVPETITFKDTTILKKTEGTYCCGFTFAVVMKAATAAGLLADKSPADVKKLQKAFYGIGKEFEDKQCVKGLETLGIGHEVKPEDAKAGDFMQLYRTKGGHSVIFLKWVESDGKKIGFTYRSSQKLTKGIGDRTEYFKDSGKEKADVDRDHIYFGRLGREEG